MDGDWGIHLDSPLYTIRASIGPSFPNHLYDNIRHMHVHTVIFYKNLFMGLSQVYGILWPILGYLSNTGMPWKSIGKRVFGQSTFNTQSRVSAVTP